MAVSPQIVQNGTEIQVNVGKPRMLPVRTNSVGVVGSEHPPKPEKGPEVTEQLNQETKQMYVKGRSAHLV